MRWRNKAECMLMTAAMREVFTGSLSVISESFCGGGASLSLSPFQLILMLLQSYLNANFSPLEFGLNRTSKKSKID